MTDFKNSFRRSHGISSNVPVVDSGKFGLLQQATLKEGFLPWFRKRQSTTFRRFCPALIVLAILLAVADLRADENAVNHDHQDLEPTVVLILKSGSSFAGRIVTESDESITLLTKADGQFDVERDDIARLVSIVQSPSTATAPSADPPTSRNDDSAEQFDDPEDSCPETFGGDLEIPLYARAERCKGGGQSVVFWVRAPVPYRRAMLDYYRAWTRANGWRGGIQPCVGTFTGDMCKWKKGYHRLTLTVQPTGYSTLLVQTK